MTTCVPIKLGGVMTHRLVMRAMCWQPGNRQAFFKKKRTKKRNMSIQEFAADCIRFARLRPGQEGEVFDLGMSKIKNEEHKAIYLAMFKKAFPNLGLV